MKGSRLFWKCQGSDEVRCVRSLDLDGFLDDLRTIAARVAHLKFDPVFALLQPLDLLRNHRCLALQIASFDPTSSVDSIIP